MFNPFFSIFSFWIHLLSLSLSPNCYKLVDLLISILIIIITVIIFTNVCVVEFSVSHLNNNHFSNSVIETWFHWVKLFH